MDYRKESMTELQPEDEEGGDKIIYYITRGSKWGSASGYQDQWDCHGVWLSGCVKCYADEKSSGRSASRI